MHYVSKDENLSNVYVNEQGRFVLSGLAFHYFIGLYSVDIVQDGEAVRLE